MYRVLCKIDSYNKITGKANYRVIYSLEDDLTLKPTLEKDKLALTVGWRVYPMLRLILNKPYKIGAYINPRKALGV